MEIQSIDELEPLLTVVDGTWLILDIDQTLIRSPLMWGSEPYYYHRIEVHRARGLADEAAILAANDEWEAAQEKIQPVAMESITGTRVSSWQTRGICVFGLTARRPEIAQLTARHLSAVGVNLTRTAPALPLLDFIGGILYVGPLASKGERIAPLLAQAKPARIVFVDDRAEHIRTVGEHARRLGISYEGRRMAAADRYQREFRPQKAEEEGLKFQNAKVTSPPSRRFP